MRKDYVNLRLCIFLLEQKESVWTILYKRSLDCKYHFMETYFYLYAVCKNVARIFSVHFSQKS